MTISNSILASLINFVEKGHMPDSLVRLGIRRLCRQRLRELQEQGDAASALDAFADLMRRGPVAPVPEKANEQHYEVPPQFFQRALGDHLKYSCCFWNNETHDLSMAEREALRQSVEHAGLEDGMDILELGCGWGSLSLYMAEQFPNASITAVSNSAPQRRFIEARARERGLDNLRVITADMNDFNTDLQFDRVVSVEMFEHMRNYEELLQRVGRWLKPEGRLFVHIFCHNEYPYTFETDGAANWMGRYFFTGGIMPSINVFSRFTSHVELEKSWTWDGTHYEKTSNAWLDNMDQHREEIMTLFADTYGADQATCWFNRWRVFFMACAELFGYEQGRQWCVGHYLLKKSAASLQSTEDADELMTTQQRGVA